MIGFNKNAAGIVIRRLRKDKNLSQEIFTGLAGIARSHLAMIETGTKQPNFETIWRIANAFEIAPHEFVELIEKEAASPNKQRGLTYFAYEQVESSQ